MEFGELGDVGVPTNGAVELEEGREVLVGGTMPIALEIDGVGSVAEVALDAAKFDVVDAAAVDDTIDVEKDVDDDAAALEVDVSVLDVMVLVLVTVTTGILGGATDVISRGSITFSPQIMPGNWSS